MAQFPVGGGVNDWLITESGRIEKRFWRQARARGVWNNQIRQSEFPLGMGEVLTKANFERSNPETAYTWSVLPLNNVPPASPSDPSNANPPFVTIDPAWTTFQFQLYYGAINSNAMSIHDIALSLNGPAQLGNTVKNLEENVLDIWEDRKQDEYDRICGHKIIFDGSVNPPESGFNQAWLNTQPDSQLNLEILEYCYDRMMRDGGAQGDWGSLEYVMGEPCPLVMVSPEARKALFRQNPDHRNDLRYSSQADRLANPLSDKFPRIRNPNIQDGSAFSHFRYANNWRAPRYNFVNGAFVRVPYYDIVATTLGNKADPGVAYRNAGYEVTYVFHPAVMELCTYDPAPGYDNGVKFDAATFTGKFKWVNNKDNGSNIDGNQGFFRALLASASRPGLPNLGYAIMSKLCPRDFSGIGCVNS